MTFYLHLNDYLKLFRFARQRTLSRDHYFNFEAAQGEMLVQYLSSQKVIVSHAKLLDLGCGFGGYMKAFSDAGIDVTGLDLTPLHFPGKKIILGDALRTPIASESFDVVICASLIEHVADPEALLREMYRILKKGGVLYLSYPPYYSPRGGHQFSPFHLLGQKTALIIAQKRGLFRKQKWLQEQFPSQPSTFENAFGEWGLFIVTIAKIKRMLRHHPLILLDCSTRWLPINFANLPVLGEFLTWHVQFLLKKP